MKAIQTKYNGYRFRSRLEARWAVFFDALGIQYQYEPEGFELGGLGKYLPDFYLPKIKVFVEIKGVEPTMREQRKARALERGAGLPVLFFVGGPGIWAREKFKEIVVWGECQHCDRPVLIWRHWKSGQDYAFKFCGHEIDKIMFHTNNLINAEEKARGARFEFGESG